MNMPYQLPREKLHEKGAASLSDVELLQVLISAGVPGIPVARIARKVARLVARRRGTPTLYELAAIPGVGQVKAGQLVAAFEYTRRRGASTTSSLQPLAVLLPELHHAITQSAQEVLAYVLLDGALGVLGEGSIEDFSDSKRPHALRAIYAAAVQARANQVYIALGSKGRSLQPGLSELTLCKELYEAAAVVSVRIQSIDLVSAEGVSPLKPKRSHRV